MLVKKIFLIVLLRGEEKQKGSLTFPMKILFPMTFEESLHSFFPFLLLAIIFCYHVYLRSQISTFVVHNTL